MRWGDDAADDTPIKTSFPILFLSNTLDPVTPLGDALAMTRKFANASIIVQDGLGHCTISCVSSCTMAYLRAYLNDGIVPPRPKFKSDTGNDGEWPTCKCLERPWKHSLREEGDGFSASEIKAYRGLRDHYAAFTSSLHLENTNPLKEYFTKRSI